MFKKHPRGLMVLFFTEMWERFGFYLMLGIFTLYMIAGSGEKFAGLGMTEKHAADIYGSYLALVYLTPFFGGLLADRILGYRRAIIMGGILMATGYLLLAIPGSMVAFYVALLVIILGNGLFKPNISVLLGKLYEKPEYEQLKDSGFNIFYMGINIGAFVCNFVAAYLRIQYGWGWAFAAAGIGMLIGVVWFVAGNFAVPNLKQADKIAQKRDTDMPLGQVFYKMFLPAIVFAVIGWLIPNNIFGADSTDAFIFLSIPLIGFYFNIWRTADEREKNPIAALLAVFGVVIVFWAIFHQNGSALTYWARSYTDREAGPVLAKILDKIEMSEEVSTVPREVQRTGPHGEDLGISMGPSYYFDNYGSLVPRGLTFKPDDVTDSDWQKIVPEERQEYGSLQLWPTELQASINPFYIIIFTPLVVAFFGYLRRRNKEPSTPMKIGLGLFITAMSMLVMVVAAIVSGSGATKASVAWLFGVYGVITIGELFLSPMGLSLVSKLSPKRIAALMMGGWFLSTAIGNKMSGVLSGLWTSFDNKAYFFLTNTGLTMIAVIAIFSMMPWLKRVVAEHTELEQ
ncbi:MFS transporter [candidate division KSB1 bacterium]|nr:MFS transporter [candidate division KSB1 bacterium]